MHQLEWVAGELEQLADELEDTKQTLLLLQDILLRGDGDVAQNVDLHEAARRGDAEAVSNLLADGADPNVVAVGGWSPLHEACIVGGEKTVAALIKAGADLKAKNNAGWTCLHLAAYNGHSSCVRLLLKNNASLVELTNNRGRTAIDYTSSPTCSRMLMEALRQNTRRRRRRKKINLFNWLH